MTSVSKCGLGRVWGGVSAVLGEEGKKSTWNNSICDPPVPRRTDSTT